VLEIVTGADVAAALQMPGAASDVFDDVAQVADELLEPFLRLDRETWETIPAPVHEAGIVIAIDVYQNRTAAGGQSVGIDGTPGPYRMGRSLLERVSGLLGPWLAVESDIG
jgi:hypothetical protein